MSGPEHYREAERLTVSAADFTAEGDTAAADRCIATAQVHATLALAAATADLLAGDTIAYSKEWKQVTR